MPEIDLDEIDLDALAGGAEVDLDALAPGGPQEPRSAAPPSLPATLTEIVSQAPSQLLTSGFSALGESEKRRKGAQKAQLEALKPKKGRGAPEVDKAVLEALQPGVPYQPPAPQPPPKVVGVAPLEGERQRVDAPPSALEQERQARRAAAWEESFQGVGESLAGLPLDLISAPQRVVNALIQSHSGEDIWSMFSRGALTPKTQAIADKLEEYHHRYKQQVKAGLIQQSPEEAEAERKIDLLLAGGRGMGALVGQALTDPLMASGAPLRHSWLLVPGMAKQAGHAGGQLLSALDDSKGEITPEVVQAATSLAGAGVFTLLGGVGAAGELGGMARARSPQARKLKAARERAPGELLAQLPPEIREQLKLSPKQQQALESVIEAQVRLQSSKPPTAGPPEIQAEAPADLAPLGAEMRGDYQLETRSGQAEAPGAPGRQDLGPAGPPRVGPEPGGEAVPGGERALGAEPYIPDELNWRKYQPEGATDGPPVVPSEESLRATQRSGQEGALTVGPKVEANRPTVQDPRYQTLLDNRRAAQEPPGMWERFKQNFSLDAIKTALLDRTHAAKSMAGIVHQAKAQEELRAELNAQGMDPALIDQLVEKLGTATKHQLNPYDQLGAMDPRVILDLATNTAGRPAWLTEVMHSVVTPIEKQGLLPDVKMWLDLNAWERRFVAAKGEQAALEAKLPMAEAGQKQRRQVGGAAAGLSRRREQLQLEGAIRQAQQSGDRVLARVLKNKRDQVYRERLQQVQKLTKGKLTKKRIEELVLEKRKGGYSDARASVKQGETKLGGTYYQLRELIRNAQTLGEDAQAPVKPIKARIAELEAQRTKGGLVPQNFTEAEVRDLITQMETKLDPARLSQVKAAGEQILKIPEKLLEIEHQKGIISTATYRAVKSLGKGYVPMFRIQEALASASKGEYGTGNLLSLAERKFLMHFEGSKLDTMDPLQATYLVTLKAFSDIAKQEAATSLVQMHKAGLQHGLDLGFKKLKSGESTKLPTITRWKKGKAERWALPEEMTPVVDALKDPGASGMMLKLLEKAGGTLRAGAVGLSIPFTVRNVPRDFGRIIYMIGKYITPGSIPKGVGLRTLYTVGKWAETMKGLVLRDPEVMKQYQDALWNRALGGTLNFEIQHMAGAGSTPAMLEVPGFTRPKGVLQGLGGKLVDTLSAGARYTEIASKLTAWRMLEEQVKRGTPGIPKDPRQRAFIVATMAGTPPSNVRGTLGREGNIFVMFGNVAAQGWRTSWERTLRDPKGTVGRALLAFTALGTTLAAWNGQFTQSEDPTRPEWDKIPLERKRDYWILLTDQINPETGRREYMKIAKPEFVKAFYNAIEGTIWEIRRQTKPEWAAQAETHRLDTAQQGLDVATELLNPLGFNVDINKPLSSIATGAVAKINPALKAPMELAANRQTFTGTPIETQSDLKVAPEERFDERTSPTMVLAGRVTKSSPKKLEYLTRTFGAGLADAILSLTDLGARRFSPQSRSPRKGEDIPVLSSLVRTLWDYGYRDTEREKRMESFYQRKTQVDQALSTYKRVKGADKGRAQEYLGDATYAQLRAESLYLSDQGEKINRIYKKLRAAPTEAEALHLNRDLTVLMERIEKELKRRETLRAARGLTPPPTAGPPVVAP